MSAGVTVISNGAKGDAESEYFVMQKYRSKYMPCLVSKSVAEGLYSRGGKGKDGPARISNIRLRIPMWRAPLNRVCTLTGANAKRVLDELQLDNGDE